MMEQPTWTLRHAQLHQTLRHRNLLKPDQRILVAVSGGQDSLCLMRLLLDLQPKWSWHLAIAHCNHRWRPDADANAEYVASLAALSELPYFSAIATTPLTSEADARDWRYRELVAIAETQGYSVIATGHTASDRAETLLYNLIRGSGSDGLQALTWQRSLTPQVQLVRPLLNVTRTETAQICNDFQISVWHDTTNDNPRYARNRLRHEVMPYLSTHFNPKLDRALATTAELLRADVEYLEAAAAELRHRAAPKTPTVNAHLCLLNRTILAEAPLALQRRALRQSLHPLVATMPSFDHVEKIVALIHAPNRTQTDPLPGGVIAFVDGEWIGIKKG